MKNNLIQVIKDFIKKEKIVFSLSQDNASEFWLDNLTKSLIVRFKMNIPKREIFYDVYAPEYAVHLKEETIKDVENLEYLAEENRRWNIAENIEELWLIIDKIKLWARQNNYSLMEKQLI